MSVSTSLSNRTLGNADVSEAESGVAKITPASKATLIGWIKTAADRIEQNTLIIAKSFRVTGIVKKPRRKHIQKLNKLLP
jgi:hypothetical protein